MGREFVFVHGMSHGAWCWEPVAARLEGSQGVPRTYVTPIDLDTAHGPMLSNPEALVAILERV
jgi:hypothetical protein